MDALNTELSLVLEKLEPMLEESISHSTLHIPRSNEALEIFDRLRPMLISHNPECINMVDEIRSIPEAEELAQQIEDFEFKQAALTLEELMKNTNHDDLE